MSLFCQCYVSCNKYGVAKHNSTSFMSLYLIEDSDSTCSTNIQQLDADADRFLTGWMYTTIVQSRHMMKHGTFALKPQECLYLLFTPKPIATVKSLH